MARNNTIESTGGTEESRGLGSAKPKKPDSAIESAARTSQQLSGVAGIRTIEEEIKQTKPFASQQHKALVNLLFSYGWATEQLREHLLPFGLTMQQYNVLRILRGAGKPMTTSEIRDRMLDRMSDSSRLVDRLERKNWATKRICSQDKRLVDVELTESGKKKLEEIEQLENGLSEIGKNLTDQQAEQLSRLLDLLRSSNQET